MPTLRAVRVLPFESPLYMWPPQEGYMYRGLEDLKQAEGGGIALPVTVQVQHPARTMKRRALRSHHEAAPAEISGLHRAALGSASTWQG